MLIRIVDKDSVMLVSQKSRYAVRAIFELAKHVGEGPVKIADIAQVQAIPPRFLEVILGQLKQVGFVKSIRGSRGGYLLARSPATLSVGEIIGFVQGPDDSIACIEGSSRRMCPLYPDCIFMPLWDKAQKAVSEVYKETTFEYLLDEEKAKNQYVTSYAI